MTDATVTETGSATPAATEASEKVRRVYDKHAARYDRGMARSERWMIPQGRQWVADRATGDVLELGIGTGRSLEHYAEDARVTGIDLSEEMLAIAADRLEDLGREATLRCADADDLPWEAGSFDTVVSMLSLCSVPDEARAVAEAWRVLRPGGRLVLLEHVRSPVRPVRILQRLFNPIAVATHHDHLLREPLEAVRARGFVVDELERERLGFVEYLSAHKPADA